MIKRRTIDRTISETQRDDELNEVRGALARELIEASDIRSNETVTVTITTVKRRNRAKDATTDVYVLTATIIAY